MRYATWWAAGVLGLALGCASSPKAPQSQPYQRLTFQEGRWVATRLGEAEAAEAQLQEAHVLYQQGQFKQAQKAFREVARKHAQARAREDALYWRAEAQFQRARYDEAYALFEQLLTEYEGTAYRDSVLERYFQIAEKFLAGEKRRLWGIPLFRDRQFGLDILERIQYHDPTGPLAERALMRAADYCFRTAADYDKAAEYYDLVVRLYPRSKWQAQAHILGALAKLYSYRGPQYDGWVLHESSEQLKSAKRRFPTPYEAVSRRLQTQGQLAGGLDSYQERIRLQEAARLFSQAEYYRRAGRPAAARHYFELVRTEFPDTQWAQEAGRCLAEL